METLKKSARRHKFNISLKRWLLKIGRIRRRGLLQKFKAQLVGLEIPNAAVREGLLQISTNCYIRLNRIPANETPWICHSKAKESKTEKGHSHCRSACDRPSSSSKKSHHRPYRDDTDTTAVSPISKNSDSHASISTHLSESPTAADRLPRLKDETSVGSKMGVHHNGSTSGQRRLNLETDRIPHKDENISHHPRKADNQIHIHGSNKPDRHGERRSRSNENCKSKHRRLTCENPNNITWRLIPIDEECIRKPPRMNILEYRRAMKRKEKLSQKYLEIFGEDESSRSDPSEMSMSLTESSDQTPDSSNESWYITGIQISKIHEIPNNRKSPILGLRNKIVNLPKKIRTTHGIKDREKSRTEVAEKESPALRNRIIIPSAQDEVSPATDDRCNTTVPALTFSSCFPIKSPKKVDVKDEKDHVVEITKKKLRTYDSDTVDQKSDKGVNCEPSTTLELDAETFSIDSNKIMDSVINSKIKDNDMDRCNDNDLSESSRKPFFEKDIKPTYEFSPDSKSCIDAEATESLLAQTTCQLSKLLTGWGISHVSSRLLGATDVIYLTLLARRRLMERRQAANQLAVRENRQKELLMAQHEFKSHIQKFLEEFLYLHQKLGTRSRVLEFIMLGLRNRTPAGSQPFARSELDFLISAANIDDFTNCEEQVLLTEMKSLPRNEEPLKKVICEIDLTNDEADQADTVDLICDSTTDLQWHSEVKCASYDHNANELPLQVPNIAEVKSISRQYFENLNEKEKIKSPCFMCGKESTVSCGQCAKTNYCSEDCQKMHWNEVHHTTCVPRLCIV